MEKKIDFIVTWVDNSDQKWREEKEKWEEILDINTSMNSEERYRDWKLMKYWFRAVERYAPWVNKVFFVTEGHIPEWLNIEHEKLVVVKHRDYIDDKYLPTFNSNVIELNFHNICELSEQFVLFNDDMLLNDYVNPEDFFKNNLPRDIGVFSPIIPEVNGISGIVLTNIEIINKYFNSSTILSKFTTKFFSLSYKKQLLKNVIALLWKPVLGFYDSHTPISHKKSTFKLLYEKENKMFLETYSHRFREKTEISHWLMRYWNLCQGEFEPQNVSFGKGYGVKDIENVEKEIIQSKHKVICINDGEKIDDFNSTREKLLKILDKKYPTQSSYEKYV